LTKGQEQEAMVKQIIQEKGITATTSDEDIDKLIHEFMKSK
jgi:Asp-tRNA(Asn)/Glu-tRNA(Gln) amidotransferase B subunit